MNTNNLQTKKELMDWHRKCVKVGYYRTAQLIMEALAKVLPTQTKEGGYLLYIASYDKEPHISGFAAYVSNTYEEHRNCRGELSHKHSDRNSICTRLIDRKTN